MRQPTPCLWFDGNAEEATNFYVSVFPKAKIENVTRFTSAGPGPEGAVLMISFELNGQAFLAINGGPDYKFTPAVSFSVLCDSQDEVDQLWTRLLEGGSAMQCGWLTDKFGLSWQIVPRLLPEYLRDEDREKANRVMQAMFKMVKLDISALKQAYERK